MMSVDRRSADASPGATSASTGSGDHAAALKDLRRSERLDPGRHDWVRRLIAELEGN